VLVCALVVALAGSLSGCVPDSSDSAAQAQAGNPHASGSAADQPSDELVRALAKARLATAKYATNLPAATAAGYKIITPMMPDMGLHYLNPTIEGFDVTKPPILVYIRSGDVVQLGALEWVFPARPLTPPLPGATYGSFDAACHYADGEFVAAASEQACAKAHPITAAPFFFWHPNLVTLHVWLWYPNPSGIYQPTNPLVRAFNVGVST
jgi:hypothetical protein